MNWNLLSDEQKAIQLLRIQKALSLADGSLNEEEHGFMSSVGRQLGLSIDAVREELASAESEVILPIVEHDRMTALYYLVFLMKADCQVNEAEEASIYRMGLKLGFRENLIRDFIRLAKKHAHEQIPPEDMIDKIRQYLN